MFVFYVILPFSLPWSNIQRFDQLIKLFRHFEYVWSNFNNCSTHNQVEIRKGIGDLFIFRFTCRQSDLAQYENLWLKISLCSSEVSTGYGQKSGYGTTLAYVAQIKTKNFDCIVVITILTLQVVCTALRTASTESWKPR